MPHDKGNDIMHCIISGGAYVHHYQTLVASVSVWMSEFDMYRDVPISSTRAIEYINAVLDDYEIHDIIASVDCDLPYPEKNILSVARLYTILIPSECVIYPTRIVFLNDLGDALINDGAYNV